MQFRYLLFIAVALLGLVFFACEQENFDETIEEVLPTDTTKIVTDDGSFKYQIQGRELVSSNGFGRRDYNEWSRSDFYIISSDAVTCGAQGSYQYNGHADFVILFFKTPGSLEEIPLLQARLKRVINGDTVIVETAFSSNNPGCSRPGATIKITEETQDYIEGFIESEFFYKETMNNSCAERRSAGIIRAEFAVPLERCDVEPTLEKGVFQYAFQGKPYNNYNNGFAKLIADDRFYIVASDSIRCTPDGMYSTAAQSDTGFVITFFKSLQNDFPGAQAVLRRVIDGDTLAVYSGAFLRACANTQPIVTIGRETDSILAGSYKAEFFELVGQNPNDCASWRSVGVLSAAFSVPLQLCE